MIRLASKSLASNEDLSTVTSQVVNEKETHAVHEGNSSIIQLVQAKPTVLVLVLTFVASISGFMFGYDTGYISSALVVIGTDLDNKVLSYGEKQFITSATSLGALIGAIFAGILADLYGRKKVILGSNVLFLWGAAMQTGCHTVWVMIGGRFIMGFGVGIGSLIAPLYISETAPTHFRGRLVVINCLSITGGQLVAYAIGAGVTHLHNGWRLLVGLSLIPPAVQFVMFFFLPDTPRYLISKGKLEEAKSVLARTHSDASPELIEAKVQEMSLTVTSMAGSNPFVQSWNAIKQLHTVPSNFRALVIGCGMQGIQQFTGFNSLMYFSATIFESIGFKDSVAVSIIVAATNFVFTIVAFFIIDKVGRRRILLVGIPGMMISLIVCAIAFHFFGIKFVDGAAVVNHVGISGWGIVIIVSMICFTATYAFSIGNVPWQQSELFQQDVRGVGTAYCTATNWAGSLVISSTFLTMLQKISATGTFSFFAGLCFVSFIFIWFCYPELGGLELEETQQLLTGGFNIKASKELARRRKQAAKLAKSGELA
ncbi:hypothetical protein BABINDRAFT_32637 [Babjeviella inositovora NRRL Y-12698]|uniref:Major facilitator superfamily (MFS) profile domain-containing protein n=1 Tax=Babjeviella inositovora NRRL Y-12698 TaxID=984486 RepID=A0A1E3QWM6_9ASCO|nr:uncharacterized protein BABINDRAFT_32637 [Babjeviella inositovora NRRL Y-12698]ODQ82041.1 hypothetical protein BABINDRAFT_32637 [Babjeviella inositovora NRRL Y-12698]